MRRKSPISVDRIQLYTYERDEEDITIFCIDQFPYDDRRDFEATEYLAGIAVRLEVCNDREDAGVRRKLALSIVDITSRCEIATAAAKVSIPRGTVSRGVCVDFPISTAPFVAGHTYRLSVADATSNTPLSEAVFHLFDSRSLGCPDRWYRPLSACIKPAWGSKTYKVLRTIDGYDYSVRFTVTPMLDPTVYPILPELELRLYYPDGKRVTAQFCEPRCLSLDDFRSSIYTVDYPFATCDSANGTFYAELLCMEWPVAGFVFDTRREDTSGALFDHDIAPLDEYTLAAAAHRLATTLYGPYSLSDADFDRMLDSFIESQMDDAE